jgi:lipopolysaccharide transport system permease protein
MHNFVLFVVLIAAFGIPFELKSLLLIPGFIIIVVNLCWISLVLGVICARYRDLPQIINSVLQIFFYLTPIMWMTSQFSGDTFAHDLLVFNPFFHLIEIVRAPLLSERIDAFHWTISIAIGLIGIIVALIFFGRYKWRVPYWM